MPKSLISIGRLLSALTVITVLNCQLGIAAAHAEDDRSFSLSKAGYHLLNGRWMSISPFYGAGGSDLSGSDSGLDPTVVGLRYSERKGFITGVFFALLMSFAGGVAAASPKSVDYYQSGNTIWEVTTYRSEAEKQALLDETARAADEMMNSEDQSVELELFSKSAPGGGESSGYKLNMYFGVKLNDYFVIDLGLGWGSIDSRFERDGRGVQTHLSYFGLPARLNIAAGPILLQLRYDWNWLGDWSEHKRNKVDEPNRFTERSTMSYAEFSASTCLFERLILQGALTTSTTNFGDLGYRASVGLRF